MSDLVEPNEFIVPFFLFELKQIDFFSVGKTEQRMRKTNSKPPGRGAGANEPVVQRRGGSVDEDKVFQGLQKKQRCKLCEQEFLVDELPGAISYNSVLKLRQK